MSRIKVILLFILFAAALALRLSLGSSAVIFPYDQARDVLIAKQIVEKKDPPLLGPVSDIPGVHHGAIYYWLITPLYFLNGYDPSLTVFVFSLFSALGVFSYFFVCRRLFGERIGWLVSILYSFSFLSIGYARWISNPTLVIPLMPIFVWLLYELVTQKRYAFALGALLGLFVQFELVTGYLVFLVAFWALRSVKFKQIIKLILGFMVGALPLIVAELKFGFQGLKGLAGYGSHQASSQAFSVGNALSDVFNRFGIIASDTVLGISPELALTCFAAMVFVLFLRRKQLGLVSNSILPLIFSILVSSLLLFCIGKRTTNFFLVGQEFIFIVATSLFLNLIFINRKIFLITAAMILIFLQLRLFSIQTRENRAYVQVQQGVLLFEREEVLRRVYEKTNGRPFTISIFGTPYGVRTAWAYYLWHYQNSHKTIIPSWYGFAADGYVGDEILPRVDAPQPIHIVIYEPDFGVGPEALETFTSYQDEHTTLVEEFMVNNHRVQLRKPL